MAADETRESETGEEPIIVLVDVFHHWPVFPSFWPSAGSPPGGGSGSTAGSPPPFTAPAPNYPSPYPFNRWYGLYLPYWFGEFLGVLAAVAAIVLVVFGLFALGQWLFNDDPGNSAPPREATGLTVPQILRAEHFATDRHALCSYTEVGDGTAYKLYLNRGGACRHTVQAVVPANMVEGFHSKNLRRSSVTFVYNHKVYGTSGINRIKRLNIGRQVMVDLRTVIARERR